MRSSGGWLPLDGASRKTQIERERVESGKVDPLKINVHCSLVSDVVVDERRTLWLVDFVCG